MTSSLTFLTRSARPLRSFPLARAAFFPKRAVVDGDDGCANVGCVRTEAPAAGRDEEGANALTLVEDSFQEVEYSSILVQVIGLASIVF